MNTKKLKLFFIVDDKERRLSLENQSTDNHSQADFNNSERVSVPPSPFKRTTNFPGGSPGHPLSQTPMRHGRDSPSIYEDENRMKSVDRRSSSRFKRINDPNVERGQGVTWKNSPTWPAHVPNGFIQFQPGPPAPGFHSGIQHFPPSSLFGARPYMDINQTGIPYHMNEGADRFAGHGHPFGWHHPADDSCHPQMQGWDGSNSFYGDKSQLYVRPDWDHNGHLVGGRGWPSLNAEMWRGQSPSMTAEFSVNQEVADESRGAYSSLQPKSEVNHLQHVSDDAILSKQYKDPPDDKSVAAAASIKTKLGKTSYKRLDNSCHSLIAYLSRVEISSDLMHPELYKDVRNILTAGNSIEENAEVPFIFGCAAATLNFFTSLDAQLSLVFHFLLCSLLCFLFLQSHKVQILTKVSKLSSLLPTAADTAFKVI